MEVKTVIVDFDGTIVDSSPIFTECINELGKEFGYRKIEKGFGLREKSAYRFFTENLGLSRERLSEWSGKFTALLKPAMRAALPFTGMKSVLEKLSACYRLGIFTSNSEQVVRHIMTRDRFAPVDFIYADVPILEKDATLRSLFFSEGISPRETIYIGDEVRDIDACRNAGIRIISVCWGFNSRAALERRGPDYLVDSPAELLDLLLPSRPSPAIPRRG